MQIQKKQEPYSRNGCRWDSEEELWRFSWEEEIPSSWVNLSIKTGIPVEDINQAHMLNPTDFDLDQKVIEEILESYNGN